jgi:hypothetical protein
MNRSNELFDDRIAAWLEDDPVHAPAQLLETVVAAMPSVPQRRAGAAWRPAGFPRWWQLVATAALVVAIGLLGLRALNPPTVAPSQSPQPTQTQPAPTPSSGSSPSLPAATPTGVAAGAPLPEDLFGAWYHAAPGWWWFLRAGDPECVQAVRTELDCVVWQRGTTPKEIGGASIVDGDLRVAWRSGFCTRITSTYSIALQGDSLNLVDIGGGCEGGNFALTRAGTGAAPTAPPPPTP